MSTSAARRGTIAAGVALLLSAVTGVGSSSAAVTPFSFGDAAKEKCPCVSPRSQPPFVLGSSRL